jgi:flagellar motor switch protein FliG
MNNVSKIFERITFIAALFMIGLPALAQVNTPGSYEKIRQETEYRVKNKVNPLLLQYCKDSCQIISVGVEIDETVSDSDDLGFEGVSGSDLSDNLFVNKVQVEVQVDDRVTQINRKRLKNIIQNHLRHVGLTTDIVWRPVTLPQIGQSAAMEEQLKRKLRTKVGGALDRVIENYCPEDCVLSQIAVDGHLITPDESSDYEARELIRDKSGRGILKIDQVDAEISMNESVQEDVRFKINNLFKVRTRFASPVDIDVQVSEFPESYSKKKARERASSEDPFGLDKLRRTLKMFRELAGTKEILTTTTTSTNSSSKNSNNLKENVNSSSVDKNSEATLNNSSGTSIMEYALYGGAIILLLGVIAFVILKFAGANRDAKIMMDQLVSNGNRGEANQGEGLGKIDGASSGMGEEARKALAMRIKIQEIREELIKLFVEAPKVAKETFTRLIQEEGVEETAKYVSIFGHLVIFELLADPNLQRELYELSEYYHKSEFDFETEEEFQLMTTLKTKVTASEIKVMSRKQMDKFDFLTKLDASQIFNLIDDEKPQLQGIVLTQLDHRRRRAVFDMYHGQKKTDLMRELCKADAIPKEYLSNVAQALHKKVTTRPEFDTENLRASDILLDLLEKADLVEQRTLMADLMNTNPEAARTIKLKLVTVEMLPYLKDGHMLEIIMGMEREDLLTFLGGTREHICSLLLSKAPEELAESWEEDLENIHSVEEQNYRLVEMKILSRMRNLASNGAISLLDINTMIFGTPDDLEAGESDEGIVNPESESSMVA